MGDAWEECPVDYAKNIEENEICGNVDIFRSTANSDQGDYDGDGIGDACDECTDSDGDYFGDPGFPGTGDPGCPEDNCPDIPNPYDPDDDGDGFGNMCDICPGYDDNADFDGDGIPDGCDNCCLDRVGDANGVGGDEPTIGDVSVMIDAKFITGTCDGILNCLNEADINQSGGMNATCDDITVGDISTLIDYLFITGASLGLPDCL